MTRSTLYISCFFLHYFCCASATILFYAAEQGNSNSVRDILEYRRNSNEVVENGNNAKRLCETEHAS